MVRRKKLLVDKQNKNIKKKERPAIRKDTSRLNWREKRENDRKGERIYKTGRGPDKMRAREKERGQ